MDARIHRRLLERQADLLAIAVCGEIMFPAGTELREYTEQGFFNDQVSTAVVDAEIAEFKRESALDWFEPACRPTGICTGATPINSIPTPEASTRTDRAWPQPDG
ncbi:MULTISPECIES: hypothetical protein [unclassified Nocardia]|uniref:hypothetical protein n=1 Tax=unclassified Nocardia TaxID=2637762 RepID=UPI0033AE6D17